jgi:hypothetical protein
LPVVRADPQRRCPLGLVGIKPDLKWASTYPRCGAAYWKSLCLFGAYRAPYPRLDGRDRAGGCFAPIPAKSPATPLGSTPWVWGSMDITPGGGVDTGIRPSRDRRGPRRRI